MITSDQSNQNLINTASKYIPGGVNSPVRAFGAVGGTPVFISKANGPYVYDTNNNKYIDYVASWGPMILGHADPDVTKAVKDAVDNSLSFGAPTIGEIELAEKIINLMPSIEKLRLVNSGTEATMSAIRLARGYTNKNKIIKFIGCYHGHSDSLLVKAGSGLLTFDTQNNAASSLGVPEAVVADTLLADFNDLDSVEKLFDNYKDQIACIILEPVPGNMNMIKPLPNFLKGLRELCDKNNSVLIFDEVMSGFRVALGGAQEIYNIKPDLTTLGKVIGGGMPIGAFGGKAEIMNLLAPLGGVYQAGTLSGNPVAVAAGLATLDKISRPGFFENLNYNSNLLLSSLNEIMLSHKIKFSYNCMGGMFGLFFNSSDNYGNQINNFNQVSQCDNKFFNKFFHGMLDKGVYLAPSAFEAGFVSSTHTKEIIEQTVNIADQVLLELK